MEIQDRPNTLLCTKFDDTIKMLKAILLEYARVHVILEVMVVEGQSDTVETQRLEEFCIGFCEKVFQNLDLGYGNEP
jgi:hypothetical protein